jgi:hypothetical protein
LTAAVAPKFPTTFYFRRIEIDLDPALYPGESGHIVWEKVRTEDSHTTSTLPIPEAILIFAICA